MRGFILGAIVAVCAASAMVAAERAGTRPSEPVSSPAGKLLKYSWGAMTADEQKETARLIDNMDRREVQIFCNTPGCQDLGEDIDEVFDMTGAASNLQRSMFELGAGMGISPDEPATRKIAAAFKTATNGRVDLKVIDQKQDGGGIVIALGRKPRK